MSALADTPPEEEADPLAEYGQWAAEHEDCFLRATVSDSVRTFLMCFCIMSFCQALYFFYRCVPVSWSSAKRRSTWDFAAVPLVEGIVYAIASAPSTIGYMRQYDGRTVVWLRTMGWFLTVPIALMQIGQMGKLSLLGYDMNSLIVWLAHTMIAFGFCSSFGQSDGIKWMFFFFGLLCLFIIHYTAYWIMVSAGGYYVGLGTIEGANIAQRIRLLMFIYFFSWSAYPLIYVLSIEGACVVEESIIAVCFAVADLFAKNIWGIVLWDTLWNSDLDGRWTSNPTAIVDAIPQKDVEASDFSVRSVPDADDEGLKRIEADMVMRPGSRRAGRTAYKDGSAPPYSAPSHASNRGHDDIELSSPPRVPFTMVGSASGGLKNVRRPGQRQSNSIDYDGAIQNGGQASNLRSSLSRDKGILETTIGTGGLNVDGYFSQSKFSDFGRTRDMSPGAGRIQDSGSMDDVVDHVRSLNQALSDLLTTDTAARPQDTHHARSSQARGVTSV